MIWYQPAIDKLQQIHQGPPFEVRLWNNERIRIGHEKGPERFVLHFRTRTSLIRSLLQSSLGLGESYANGSVVVEGDLEDVLTALGSAYLRLSPPGAVKRFVRKLLSRSLPQEKADVERHYGLGNAFYEMYLDKRLQYSCGYFRTPQDTLDQAQEQKIAHTVRKLDLRPGQRLLDIGCGWGHLMFHAAEEYGVECVGLTLCDNQATYIREQAAARGLKVDVRIANYLEFETQEKWDRVVSVGMMCHVGQNKADAFYDKLHSLLAPGAICLTHCISKMKEAPGADPFVEKHVFPGYWFFSLEGQTRRSVERGLNVIDVENLRRHYAMTAHHWRRNFLRNYALIKARMNFDDQFMRTWEFYLASVVAGFRSGHLNLIQMVMSNGIQDTYPLTREFLYADRHDPADEPMPQFPLRPHVVTTTNEDPSWPEQDAR
ncbi:MAG TPA: cyclopropane-fatty-acyl-phospholipid synthase family protein [Polyangium sp.]|nr:cyclopropane-fatty-acyl-phospholipid synthase family protein [Polyangium sp.]